MFYVIDLDVRQSRQANDNVSIASAIALLSNKFENVNKLFFV